MLIVSMGVSLDGFINDREGKFAWSVPSEEQFAFHLEQVKGLGACLLGRRLYETMLVWETDPSLPDTDDEREFAEVWTAIPKVVFSRTLTAVEGNARLAQGSIADEVARAVDSTDLAVEIGGATLSAQALELGLVDEIHLFRNPVIVGGGTPLLPAVTSAIPLTLLDTRTFAGHVLYERYGRGADGSTQETAQETAEEARA